MAETKTCGHVTVELMCRIGDNEPQSLGFGTSGLARRALMAPACTRSFWHLPHDVDTGVRCPGVTGGPSLAVLLVRRPVLSDLTAVTVVRANQVAAA